MWTRRIDNTHREGLDRLKEVLVLQFSFFAMMVLGYALRRRGLVTRTGQREITDLIVALILPCNIITSFLTDMGEGILRDGLHVLLISLGIQLAMLFYGKLFFFREREDRLRSIRYAFICSNAGFLGNPVAEGVFGPEGLMLASIYLIPQRIMMWSEGLAIFSGEADWRSTLKKLATHPCVIACGVGLVLMVTRLPVPALILTPIRYIGRCNTALVMLMMGMTMAGADLRSLWDASILRFCLHRLVVIPLVLYGILCLLPVSRLVRGLSVLLAAMPAGATTSILASKYARDPEFAAKLVTVSTVFSVPALAVWSMVLR